MSDQTTGALLRAITNKGSKLPLLAFDNLAKTTR
jgi:hypothetical protein